MENIIEEVLDSTKWITNIAFHDEGVMLLTGGLKKLRYQDLTKILAVTTDQAPDDIDYFLVLETPKMKAIIPQNVLEFDKLLEELQEIPRFDEDAIDNALESFENNVFTCWKK